MPLYKHYSFDVWMTLIRSNPTFKAERARHLHRHYNPARKTLDEVQVLIRQVDLTCNAINERTGGNIEAEEMYGLVLSAMTDYGPSLPDVDLAALYAEVDALVLANLPIVYCSETVRVLDRLASRGGVKISLLSNTAFIKGATLRTVLQEIGLAPYFDFQLYSDEVGHSKPSPRLFGHFRQTVADRWAEPLQPADIIHVGDNYNADVLGARALGIHSLLVNSNNTCISTLLA